ncbi:MAG: DUF47 family protein [Pirellulales bacterium]|nr:DUF47 family protein [Pirellulales bacterium]
MFSLQRFFAKSDKFFDLLDASAEQSRLAAMALVEVLKAPEKSPKLEEIVERRRQNKRINEEITSLLCGTFVTPLEREDIETLARALYRIPKIIEKFYERLALCPSPPSAEFFHKQSELMDRATQTVCEMVRQLRRHPQLDRITRQNDLLHHLEGEADHIILELMRELYSGRHEVLQVLVLRDLFELLEKVIDRCRDAGNVVFQILLKNS